MNKSNLSLLIFFSSLSLFLAQSCVSSHVFEDAQVVGDGNQSVEMSFARALYKPTASIPDVLTNFYKDRDIGTTRISFIHGVSDQTDIGGGIDLPVGLYFRMKHRLNMESLHHLHTIKAELNIPLRYYFFEEREYPLLAFMPSYIYSYRYDDLLSASFNATVMSIQTNQRFTHIPGIAAGIHLGDEVKFTAGVSYFNNFSYFGARNIQYFSVEASIKYDLPFGRKPDRKL